MPLLSTKWTIETVFFAIPLNLIPLLPTNTRMDMIDLFDAGQKAEVVNRLGGVSTLLSKTPQHLDVQLAEGIYWKLSLLPDSTMQITQTYDEVDTTILVRHYTREWKEIRTTSSLSEK